MTRRQLGLALVALLIATPALAADRAIQSGIDLWQTRGDGSTYADFSQKAIPAGFFCFKSAPFTGRIVFQGTPIVSDSPEALAKADTIVQRLDDAVFNRRGVATTRVQLKAMTFESVSPVQTACGLFNATLRLDGEQPITRMVIRREDKLGGSFSAPIYANVKVSFTPVGRSTTEALEIPIQVRFPPLPNQKWANPEGTSVRGIPGFVRVDTDGDRVTDTYLPGTSNFLAGFSARPGRRQRRDQAPVGGWISLADRDQGVDREVPAGEAGRADRHGKPPLLNGTQGR
jgi:hypothetical protein